MKLKAKKFVYFINDVTNIMLKKERIRAEENAEKLRVALIIISVILILSLVLNFYLFIS